MIIIGSKEGQFANRVLHFAHILSFCKANNITLYHPFFREYSPYFPNLHAESLVCFPSGNIFSRWCWKLLIFFVRVLLKFKIYNLGFFEIIYYDRYDQEAPVFNLSEEKIKKKAKKKILVFYGWLFRDRENFDRLEPYIKKMFSVKEIYNAQASRLLDEVKKDCSTVVGVHIRRGDYKRFENGRWYFEDEVYLEKMQVINAQLQQTNGKTAFLLCSNEQLELQKFCDLQVYNFQDDFIIDFLLLAKSDYIIGPPSTFSALASFYGNKPLQFIPDKEHQPDITQFAVCQLL